MTLLNTNASDPAGKVAPLKQTGVAAAYNNPLAANQTVILTIDNENQDPDGWILTDGYSTIFRTIVSDVPSANNGVVVEFADKDKNILFGGVASSTYDPSVLPSGVAQALSFMVRGVYMRYKYTNGPVAQTKFSYMIWLALSRVQTTAQMMFSPILQSTFSETVKSVSFGYDAATNTYLPVFQENGAMQVKVMNDETDATGVTPLSGATGIRGWLSSIYQRLTNGTQKTQIVDGNNQTYGGVDKPLNVAGTFYPPTQQVGGTVGVNNFPTLQQISVTQTNTSGYPIKGYYQPSGTGGGFTLIATGTHKLGAMHITNTNTNSIVIMLYDKATAPNSTDAVVQAYAIPANTTVSLQLGTGVNFSNGIGIGAAVGSNLLNLVTLLLTSISPGSITVSYSYI